jgi:hypothetical protein
VLRADDIDEVARSYGLGADPRLTGTVERGEQGQVWQLETALGLWAVKTSFELGEEELDGEDTADPSEPEEERRRQVGRVAECVDEPLTLAVIDELLEAVG